MQLYTVASKHNLTINYAQYFCLIVFWFGAVQVFINQHLSGLFHFDKYCSDASHQTTTKTEWQMAGLIL